MCKEMCWWVWYTSRWCCDLLFQKGDWKVTPYVTALVLVSAIQQQAEPPTHSLKLAAAYLAARQLCQGFA